MGSAVLEKQRPVVTAAARDVGEPINPEAWVWYWQHIGGGRCPVVDTWWQTETGAIMISPLPGATTLKPGSATFPLPGIAADVVRRRRRARRRSPVAATSCSTRPWPSMLRGIWGDPERYHDTYWGRFPGRYFAGDGAKRDDDGYFWLLGRVDDVMLVSGHNISTAEVEHALGRPSGRRRSGRRRPYRRDQRAGDRGLRDPAVGQRAERRARRRVARPRRATRSDRSRSRSRSSSPRISPRPGRARSCAGCCATSARTRRSVTRRRWPTRPWSRGSSRGTSRRRARQDEE